MEVWVEMEQPLGQLRPKEARRAEGGGTIDGPCCARPPCLQRRGGLWDEPGPCQWRVRERNWECGLVVALAVSERRR